MSAAGRSLLKMDPPVAATEVRKPRAIKLKNTKAGAAGADQRKEPDGKRTIPPVDDILNAILPPEPVAADDGTQLLRCVSSQPATRLDLVQLQESLDDELLRRQARESGVCAVRSELYSQAFNELIREVTCECPERGLLLLRVRDDLHATLAAHRTLYQNSVAFGSRKMLVADKGLPELRTSITRLESEKRALEVRVLELQARCEEIETQAQAHRAAEEKRHADDVNFYRKTNHQLASQLKTETDRANTKK